MSRSLPNRTLRLQVISIHCKCYFAVFLSRINVFNMNDKKSGPTSSNLPWCPSDVLAWKELRRILEKLDFVVTVNCVADGRNFACLNYSMVFQYLAIIPLWHVKVLTKCTVKFVLLSNERVSVWYVACRYVCSCVKPYQIRYVCAFVCPSHCIGKLGSHWKIFRNILFCGGWGWVVGDWY